MLHLHSAVLFKKSRGSGQVAGAVDRVADAADSLLGGDLHGAFGHLHRRPKLILVAVRIGKVDDRAFFAFGGGLYRIGVRDFVLLEPAHVSVDILGPDVKSATGHILAQLFGLGIVFRLEKSADAAGSAFPPHEAEDRRILFSHVSRESIDRPWRKAD